MPGAIRKAAIRRVAEEQRVSYAVASTIYSAWSIKRKQRACSAEERRQAKVRRDAAPKEQSLDGDVSEARLDRAMGQWHPTRAKITIAGREILVSGLVPSRDGGLR